MNPELAWLYKCRLTEELARRNNLVPGTDQMPAHAVMDGPVDVRSLLGQVGRPLRSADFQAGFGLLSINAVVPQDLDRVSPAKIVEIRRRFAAQFDRWRQYSDEVAAALEVELQDVESPQVLQAYLDDAVKRFASRPADDIRHGLADVGVNAALTALNTKFAVPAAAVTGLTAPPIAVAGGIALAATNLRQSTRRLAQAQQTAPAAYLFSVREALTPKTWLTQILAVMRWASGLRS